MDKQPKTNTLSQLSNAILHDLKVLSGILQPVSKTLYQNNNTILNQLLIAKQQQTIEMIKKILTHCLYLAQHKNLASPALTIISKIIPFTKSIKFSELDKQANMLYILSHIIDSICLISVQQLGQDISLRVVQTTFSLIDQDLVKYFKINILTRVYSTFFEECKSNLMIKNICVSALFALTECLFGFGPIPQSFEIMQSFLSYLLAGKKYSWIKGNEINGLIWDLSVVAIKNFTPNHIIKLEERAELKKMLCKMYNLATDLIFLKKSKDFYNISPVNRKTLKQSQQFADFVRYFKAYVALSNSLSIQACRVIERQIIQFRETVPKLLLICDLQRNSRMFIFLQAICQLLLSQHDLPLSVDKGIIMIEIISKISEELCLCNQSIKVYWDNNELYLDKIIQDEPKINDGDFVRLIKNTIFQLRHKYQKDQDLLLSKKQAQKSARSISNLPANMGNSKKWQSLIKCIIKTVRYLSSLGFILGEQEQDPTRKIVLQLQYWFLISPCYKAKNMILQQLLITSTQLTNKLQAVKVSQCVQIGSNIMYGYYEDLDSIGLTIILKMMAGVKADWEEGKSFEELDEIYNLATNIFKEQNLIKNEKQFTITIQAIVQCANSLLADLQQPKQKLLSSPAYSTKRQYKMIEYIIERLIMVVRNNVEFAAAQWNFITAFFLTLCCGKNPKIRQDGIDQIGILVFDILKSENQQYSIKRQQDVMGLYLELSKTNIKEIQFKIIEQLKGIMPQIQHQTALMDGFRIAKIFSQPNKDRKQILSDIHELQQILIKQCLFRITDRKYLKMILDGMQIKLAEKNQEYRLINLCWNISDHFRNIMMESEVSKQFYDLWDNLFRNIWSICQMSHSSESKQSAIHVMTQILGETASLLEFQFIISIIQKYYEPMVLLLLGIHPSAYIQSQKTTQTSKIAMKNLIKTFKKLLSKVDKDQKQTQQIINSINSINQQITTYIQSQISNKKIGNISVEMLLELVFYILHVTEDQTFRGYRLEDNLKSMFQRMQDLIKMCQEVEVDKQKIDLKGHIFKKKLKPNLDKIADFYSKQVVSQDQNGETI